jgi:hypothetical protein
VCSTARGRGDWRAEGPGASRGGCRGGPALRARENQRDFRAGVAILIPLEASWLKLPARQEGLAAGVSIAIEGIEVLESFYEGKSWSRGRSRLVSEPSRLIRVGAVFVLEKPEESGGEVLRWRR